MEQEILNAVNEIDYRPMAEHTLAKMLGVRKNQLPDFRHALADLIEKGRIRLDKKGRIRPLGSIGIVAGVVRKISSGAAYVIPSDAGSAGEGDIFISARDLRDAQTGDDVLVRLSARRRSGGQRTGVIEKIVERATSVFVGSYLESGGQGFVQIDGTQFQQPIHVGDPGAKGAMPGDKVVIEMLRFPTASRHGEAVLTEVLGKRGDPGVDTKSVIFSLGLPTEFPSTVLEDARSQADAFHEDRLDGRMDLTNDLIVTIDPKDARDFDDAISLTKSDDGHWHLGVHIADVAHFVKQGSPLDEEARKRGTSVYLPRHVIPMLPEVISNGLASLQQGQLRYTKSVFIEFDDSGSVVGSDVANTAINVARRFAYEEVMPIIQHPRKQFADVTAPVRHLLERMYELAMILRRRRFAGGALQMGIPEIEIDFDHDGGVTGAHMRHHDESHEIIEEFMLAANIAVAKLLESKGFSFLRRVHGVPDELKMQNFQQFCMGLGITLKKFQSRTDLQKVIESVVGKPEERAVNFALLRSMKQAEYSPDAIGHYALAEEDYCHFTSPIRRYPDLTIHRLIGQIAAKKPVSALPIEELIALGKSCSLTERRAERAERELIKIKLLRYMSERIGEEMDAVITGVESFGMFCQGVNVPAEGMIHLSTLADDFYTFDQPTRRLIGSRTRHEYRLGDPIRVVIAAVDVDRRTLDLRPVTGSASSTSATRGTERHRVADSRSFQGRRTKKNSSARPQNKSARKGKRRGR